MKRVGPAGIRPAGFSNSFAASFNFQIRCTGKQRSPQGWIHWEQRFRGETLEIAKAEMKRYTKGIKDLKWTLLA